MFRTFSSLGKSLREEAGGEKGLKVPRRIRFRRGTFYARKCCDKQHYVQYVLFIVAIISNDDMNVNSGINVWSATSLYSIGRCRFVEPTNEAAVIGSVGHSKVPSSVTMTRGRWFATLSTEETPEHSWESFYFVKRDFAPGMSYNSGWKAVIRVKRRGRAHSCPVILAGAVAHNIATFRKNTCYYAKSLICRNNSLARAISFHTRSVQLDNYFCHVFLYFLEDYLEKHV